MFLDGRFDDDDNDKNKNKNSFEKFFCVFSAEEKTMCFQILLATSI
jgi:hypothetical protein